MAAALEAGALGLIPTDTVYGLVCIASRRDAALDLYRLKGRPEIQPTAVVAASTDALLGCFPGLDSAVVAGVRALLPGPFTLIIPNPERRFDWLSGSSPGHDRRSRSRARWRRGGGRRGGRSRRCNERQPSWWPRPVPSRRRSGRDSRRCRLRRRRRRTPGHPVHRDRPLRRARLPYAASAPAIPMLRSPGWHPSSQNHYDTPTPRLRGANSVEACAGSSFSAAGDGDRHLGGRRPECRRRRSGRAHGNGQLRLRHGGDAERHRQPERSRNGLVVRVRHLDGVRIQDCHDRRRLGRLERPGLEGAERARACNDLSLSARREEHVGDRQRC